MATEEIVEEVQGRGGVKEIVQEIVQAIVQAIMQEVARQEVRQHILVSHSKTMASPRGVATFQSSSVCVDTLYSASSNIGINSRFTILFEPNLKVLVLALLLE